MSDNNNIPSNDQAYSNGFAIGQQNPQQQHFTPQQIPNYDQRINTNNGLDDSRK